MRHGVAGHKRDGSEAAIVAALRAVGASVERLHVVDLLVGFRGTNYLLEAKTKRGLKRKDQPDQEKWRREWRGQVTVVSEPVEALQAIGVRVR